MITIDRVHIKQSEGGNPYAEIWSGAQRYSSKDLTWKDRIGSHVDEAFVIRHGKYLNLPNVSVVFAVDPRATVPVVPQAPNGLQARQTQEERYEILSRQVAEILAILRAHFK